MAGAVTGQSEVTDNSIGGGLYTVTTDVSWIFVTSHLMLEPDGDWLLADHLISAYMKMLAVGGPSEMKPRDLQDVVGYAVCLLQKHNC